MVEKRFVILGYGRSGSTTFKNLLSQHPRVQAYGEVFRAGKGQPPPQANGQRFSSGMDPVAFLNEALFASPNEFGKSTVGFKLFFYHARGDQMSYRLWPHLCGRRDLKVIFLFRRNLFDSYVSQERAMRSRQYGLAKQAVASKAHQAAFNIDVVDCLNHMKTRSQAKARLQELFSEQESLAIDHETLFSAPQETMAQAFAFLGEEPIRVKVKDRKINRIAHSEGITNYPEVARFFQRSLYEEFFDLSELSEAELGERSYLDRKVSALRLRYLKLRAAWKDVDQTW